MSSLTSREKFQGRPEGCMVTEKQVIAPGYCRLSFKAPHIAETAYPGQFVMVYMNFCYRHLLPRPFSIFTRNRDKEEVSLLFAVKGQGTELMAAAEVGSLWKISGPLGSGFPALPEGSLLVAGGIGLAPLTFLAASTEKPRTLIYGARTASQLICPPGVLDLPNLEVIEVTEDGTRGERGTAADLLLGLLPGPPALFACGPGPMLRAVKTLCLHSGTPAWFSVEEKMACGIGACLGCAVQTPKGYSRVCREGPVLSAGEVLNYE